MTGFLGVVGCSCGCTHKITEYELMSLKAEYNHNRMVVDYSPTPEIRCSCGRVLKVQVNLTLLPEEHR